ncbi:MAG: RnfABCDGE type electron transport complex subunit B [Bacteroidales bacterium]|nr:RnfABCDGE type electron transport complex subunit B [Bacteroidales bacterium]
MNEIITATIITVSSVGLASAVILYWASQKFKVFEDPRIDEVERDLPAANCGGCGFPGCRNFAEACVKADNLDDLFCPVGGNETMTKVAKILGREVQEKDKQVAVIKCNGAPQFRKKITEYDGAENCTIVANLYSGNTACQYGCIGLGECVDACNFDAMYMDSETELPVVLEDKCTACGACVEACPKDIIELRPAGKKNRRIFVSCINQDKGGTAKKVCSVACTGCSLCFKECKYDAITIENFLSYIDPVKCVFCRKCVSICPTDAIWEVNFPARKIKLVEKEVNLVKAAKGNTEKEEKKTNTDNRI